MLGALMLAESFRPSLLPRTLVTQVGLSALAAVTGYAIGAVAGAIGRVIITRITGATASARFVQPIGLSMAVIAVAVAFAHASGRLQLQAGQRAALGLDAAVPSTLLVLVGATVGAILMVLLGRCLRGGARRLGRPLTARLGWSPRSATIAGGVLETAICLVLVAGLVALVRPVSASRDRRIGAGERPPVSALRSGGPGSRISWATLGVQGRRFVAGGLSVREIGHLRESPTAVEPIRVYVGLMSAPTPAARTALAVHELQRTGGFRRAAIVVATPSGTGFVNPVAVDPVELMFGGDVASVAMQYSVLPSFLSLALDGSASADAGRRLLSAVLARVRRLPPDDRPAVYVYGESLGAYGSQAAFAGRGIAGLHQVSGALWIGPTEASGLRKELLAGATTGPAREPIVGGGAVVRFADDAAGLREQGQPWGQCGRRTYNMRQTQSSGSRHRWRGPSRSGSASRRDLEFRRTWSGGRCSRSSRC
ncbi:MAG TPA: alpha/beta-hydrolase family protein [Euzebyales bacterium]